MIDKFENLQEEKKKKILDVAIEEFAVKGYDQASTNSIVSKAGISKGILFHYFGNKKNLFLYIFDYCMVNLTDQYYPKNESDPKDVFEKFMWISIRKIKIMSEEPFMSKLVFSAISNMPESLKQELTERYNAYYSKYMPEFFEGIDTSNFREEIDKQKAIELIMMCMDGISNKYLRKYKNNPIDDILDHIENIMSECKDYMEILKSGLYKGI